VLGHRVTSTARADIEGVTADRILRELLEHTAAPR